MIGGKILGGKYKLLSGYNGIIKLGGVCMCNIKFSRDEKLITLVEELTNELKLVYGNYLKDIILYGFYARGDYDFESDMDIMVLVDLDDVRQREFRAILAERVTDISIKNDILISVIDNNYNDFNARSSYVPFYKNIVQEGIKIYAN